MDHDDDGHSGLDELSRLFDAGTAPSPVVTPTVETPVLSPTTPFEDPPVSAFGRPTPPLYSAPVSSPPVERGPIEQGTIERGPIEPGPGASGPAAPRPDVVVPPAVAPSFGTPASGLPVVAPGVLSAASPVAPYAPPPLEPAALASGAPSAPVASIVSPPAPPVAPPASAPPAPRSTTPPIAPAFGGVPIAVARSAPLHPVPAAVVAPAPVAPPASSPVPSPLRVAPVVDPPVVSTAVLATAPSTPPAPPPPAPYTGQGPLLPGGSLDDIVDDAQVARASLAERIFFVLAVVLPPIGLIGTAVAAVASHRRRGWVIGLLRAGLAIGVVMSIATVGIGYLGYKAVRQQQAHAQTVAESTAFCAAFAKDATLGTADGGWPQPAASIPDSMTAMQAYVDRWTTLAKVSPGGIQAQVSAVAAAGAGIIKAVQVQRTVDDAQNRAVLTSAVRASDVAGWRADYCE